MKDKILVIDKSPILRDFIKEELEKYNCEVVTISNTFEGVIKMKNLRPDLIIIDYFMVANDEKADFFKEKKEYKAVSDIPVILLASGIDMNAVISAAKYKVAKILSKPLKLELFLETVSEIIQTPMTLDDSPCILDVHFNHGILFLELGLGLNSSKIDALKYKIIELRQIYKVKRMKVLMMINDVKLQNSDAKKFYQLIHNILDSTHTSLNSFKILTTNGQVVKFLGMSDKLKKIEVVSDISLAMDSLGQIDLEGLISEELEAGEFTISSETRTTDLGIEKEFSVAIVDDDEMIRNFVSSVLSTMNCNIEMYPDGSEFVKSLVLEVPDLIFLDIMMPNMSGFEVLSRLKKMDIKVPVIMFSSISEKANVIKALQMGVKSYIVKPVDPELIIRKTQEILDSSL